jgi:hypothetical protein
MQTPPSPTSCQINNYWLHPYFTFQSVIEVYKFYGCQIIVFMDNESLMILNYIHLHHYRVVHVYHYVIICICTHPFSYPSIYLCIHEFKILYYNTYLPLYNIFRYDQLYVCDAYIVLALSFSISLNLYGVIALFYILIHE